MNIAMARPLTFGWPKGVLALLAGLSVALDSLVNRADAAFVTSCDVPLLRPAVRSATMRVTDSAISVTRTCRNSTL